MYLKFFLISAVGELEERTAPDERDSEWTDIVQTGKLKQIIDDAFSLSEASNLQPTDRELAEDLKTMLTLVSAGWCLQSSVGEQ